MGLVVVAHALPPPTINEVRIDCHMFVTRVNMDLNIIYCENRYSLYFFVLVVCILCSMGLARSFEIFDSCDVILVLYESVEFTLIITTFIFIAFLEDRGK